MPFIIDIDPVAVRFGPLEIRWHGIAIRVYSQGVSADVEPR
jgi:prolipoprotein diacylglyceryltransferase